MILSVSRRTDIPRYFPDWFFNRIKEGYVLVRNPYNPSQVSRVPLGREVVDCIAFWTKNPAPLLNRLGELEGYNYYFQFTLNAYPHQYETGLPSREELLTTFKEFSRVIGPARVVWRYSPVFYAADLDYRFHRENFAYIARQLEGYGEQVFISFLDMYKKIEPVSRRMEIRIPDLEEKIRLVGFFYETAARYGLKAAACGSDYHLFKDYIPPASCINGPLIESLMGCKTDLKKDRNQKGSCACAESVDIGAYNSCLNGCVYCYANHSLPVVQQTMDRHDPLSPFLIGHGREGDLLTHRKVRSHKVPLSIEDYLSP